jgi:Tfp pilus assembly protein PilF/predicted aspartyl protease
VARARLLLSQMCFAWIVLVALLASGCLAQAQPANAAPLKKSCSVNTSAPNPAETALNKGDFKPAEDLFRPLLAKDANDDAAHEGLIRALIAQNKVDDAAKDAESWIAAVPTNSMALTALGDVRFRQGNPREGFAQFQKAVQADLCNARAHYGEARVDDLAGYFASGKQEIEQAYKLHPTDDDIYGAWISTRPRAERLKLMADYVEHSDQITDKNRKEMKTDLESQSQFHASDCRMTAASPREATVPIVPVMENPVIFLGFGLDVKFNGQRHRLQIDTGATGILVSRDVAKSLGIKSEASDSVSGVGDKGSVKATIGHVASIKIGGLEFTNCPVEVLDKQSVVGTEGLIGGDVFSKSLLTLDFPKRELRVAPLPERPGEKKIDPANQDAAADEDPEPHDPYVAPGMEKWQWVFRSGHELLMPTGIVQSKRMKDESAWKEKLFIMDTGAEMNMISPAAAKEVTKVASNGSLEIEGISGKVNKVFEAEKFTLSFAGQRLDSMSMSSFDSTKDSHNIGVEMSGFLGAPALFQLVLHIDYRDNLVLCEYTKR